MNIIQGVLTCIIIFAFATFVFILMVGIPEGFMGSRVTIGPPTPTFELQPGPEMLVFPPPRQNRPSYGI